MADVEIVTIFDIEDLPPRAVDTFTIVTAQAAPEIKIMVQTFTGIGHFGFFRVPIGAFSVDAGGNVSAAWRYF